MCGGDEARVLRGEMAMGLRGGMKQQFWRSIATDKNKFVAALENMCLCLSRHLPLTPRCAHILSMFGLCAAQDVSSSVRKAL